GADGGVGGDRFSSTGDPPSARAGAAEPGGRAADPERGARAADPERGARGAEPERGARAAEPERGARADQPEASPVAGVTSAWVASEPVAGESERALGSPASGGAGPSPEPDAGPHDSTTPSQLNAL